jgi:GntR family transcriptional regulator
MTRPPEQATIAWSPQAISFHRSDGTPKYIAIGRAIASAITEGELPEGALLPSQRDLADSFGVTIMTVRQAIQVLTEQGIVVPTQGRGTYVTRQPYRLPLGPLASFAAQIEASGRKLHTEVLGFGPIDVSPIEQRRMGLPTAEAFEVVRLRIVDGRPAVLQTSLLPREAGLRLDAAELTTRSLYDVLQKDLGRTIARATETVQATLLDAETARILGRREGEAALVSARLTFDAHGVAVLDDRALTAGDTVVVSTERRAEDIGITLMLSDDAELPEGRPMPLRNATSVSSQPVAGGGQS